MNASHTNHPTLEQLAAFAHGKLSAGDLQALETHVGGCETCRDVLREIPHDELIDRLRSAGSTLECTQADSPGPNLRTVAAPAGANPTIPPTLIDHPRYEIVKQLGAGGMGIVYLAKHRLMGRTVALKVISGKLLKNAAAVERFRHEVKAAARLSHRNIVTAFDAEQAGDVHFLIMEFVAGTDLAAIVKSRGRLPVLYACNYTMQVAQGLQHAHEQGMVHRDIKPQNLMVTPKGAVKILDFGLARLATHNDDDNDQPELTREGATLGTPDYMSPEQARDSRRADIRSDIYSLGCTLYYLLAGVVPFPVGTAMDKVIAHCERQPAPLAGLRNDIPEEVIRIIERMMAKDPAERMQTPKEVIEALRPFATLKPAAEPPLSIESTRVDVSSPLAAMEAPVNAVKPASRLDSSDPFATVDFQAESPSFAIQAPARRAAPAWLSRLQRHRWPMVAAAVALVLIAIVFIALQNPGETKQETSANGTDWTELIPQVDPVGQAVAGMWQRNGDELTVEVAESARLTLPAPPGPEYDFEVVFTRSSGTHSIALMFVMNSGQATFEVDAWGSHLGGIQMIDGRDMRANGTQFAMEPLAPGRTYTALVRVRRDQVQAYLDGKLVATYQGDGSNLSLLKLWSLPDAKRLGVGSYRSATTFHHVRVRRAS